jgi:hypothetical protein
VDNKGTVDLINNWNSGGRTRHMDARKLFSRELEEDNILSTIWGDGGEIRSDAMTKNLQGSAFEKHISKLLGEDEYMRETIGHSKGDGVADGLFALCEAKQRAIVRQCRTGFLVCTPNKIGIGEEKNGLIL